MTKDVNVFLRDFPNTKEKEMVTENADGTYSVFINSRMAHDQQLLAYRHALEHIQNDDFQKASVQQIEAIAHAEQTIDGQSTPVITRKKRRRRNRYGQYEKQRRALAAFGVDTWSQHEAHWLDPDYRF